MPFLQILHEETPYSEIPLDRDLMVLGRDEGCDVPLHDREVSKRHAQIVRRDGGFVLEDLGSTNGTKVGDRPLGGPHRLGDGDLIGVGGTRLRFIQDNVTVLSFQEASSGTDLQVAAVRPAEKLQALLEIAANLGGIIDLDDVLGRVLESLSRIFPRSERGFVLLRGEGAEELVLRASRLRDPQDGAPTISRTVFRRVVQEGQVLLCNDVGADSSLADSPSVKESGVRTILCVPLLGRERRPFGVLQIDTRDRRGWFREEDRDLLAAVAGPVGVAIENARLHEVAVRQAVLEREARAARQVQLALIPRHRPDLPGYDFWHAYEPARFVGGDFFDYRPLPGGEPSEGRPAGRWAIALGDVEGKGMAAALVMARISAELGLLLQIEPDPARVVRRLNRNLFDEEGNVVKTVTFLLVVLDVGRREWTMVNAGHMPPLVRRPDGSVEEIPPERSGPPLGYEGDAAYEAHRFPLRPGEVVVLYSDGITDARDAGAHEFRSDRLRQVLAAAPAGVEAAGAAILAAVRCHSEGSDPSVDADDMTLLGFGMGQAGRDEG